MGWLRRIVTGLGLAVLGVVGGFLGSLFRRRTPSDRAADQGARPADR